MPSPSRLRIAGKTISAIVWASARAASDIWERWGEVAMGEERLQALLQEPVGCDQDQGDQAIRAVTGHRRYDGSAQERDVPHRCEASEPGAREADAASSDTCSAFAPVPCTGGQVRSHPASTLCPRQAVQARQPDAQEAAQLSRRVIRDIGRKIADNGGLEAAFATLLLPARRVREQTRHQRGRRCVPCMRRKSNASAKAKPIGLTSSASRSALPPPQALQGRPVRHHVSASADR
jgi:hypothetical protein